MDDIGSRGLDRRRALAGGAAFLMGTGGGRSEAATQKAKLAEVIAKYAVEYDFTKAPETVVEAARVAFIDTIGVMLAGSHEDVAQIALKVIFEEGGAPRATIIGSDQRTSLQSAALANGVAAHAMDFDFTYGSGQAVSSVIPALLPLAENLGASPSETLAAFVIACEVAARLIRASPQMSALGGWHATGMVGNIAAGIACARLLKLPADRIVDVVGIGVSLASGVSANFGTMTKPLHSGNAARNGVTAAMLAARGFTGSANALEDKAGYYATFSRALPVNLSSFDDLGAANNIVQPGYKLKRYPCGGLSHTSIDATLALRSELASRVDDIEKIEVGVTNNAFQRIGSDYPHSIESAKFSMPYIGAWTVLYGAPSIETFTEKAIEDPRVKAFAPKISHHVDAEFGDELEQAPGRVIVTMKDGSKHEKKVWYASGTPQNPMTPAQIEAKFLDCAKQSKSEERGRAILAWLSDIKNQKSFNGLWPLLKA